MNITKTEFKRKFAISMYKDLSFELARMSFSKDFVGDSRGDPYPLLEKSEGCVERVEKGCFHVSDGCSKRFFCEFFPYATYELRAETRCGEAGFVFSLPSTEACLIFSREQIFFRCGKARERFGFDLKNDGKLSFSVSCRPGAFDIFAKNGGKSEYIHTFKADEFGISDKYSEFSEGHVALYASECAVNKVVSYIDNGISIADMRPIRYENGDVMVEGGLVYITASIRLIEGCMQGVFSWVPGTSEFRLCGAIYYDAGDGRWCGDVAASILYNRKDSMWYLWVCSFSHGHILGHSRFEGDPRFGVNVIDIKLMKKADEGNKLSAFVGFFRDEDPDFYYDEEEDVWFMAICRHDPASRGYKYFFFKSDSPFDGYTCIGRGIDGAETGGSFVKVDGKRYFICGNRFDLVSNYRIYSKEGMSEAEFNYPDGGFRGWGTLMPIRMGSRVRRFWLTFDRHKGSEYNWSYGDLYLFEG